MNQVLKFRPHYAVFSVPSSDPSIYRDMCSDTSGKYCAEAPDASGVVTGKAVLEEDVRQLCVHEMTKVQRTSLDDLKAGRDMVEYQRSIGSMWRSSQMSALLMEANLFTSSVRNVRSAC